MEVLIQEGRAACVVAVILFLITFPGQAAAQLPDYEVKAAFIFNFAKFVQWPQGAFSDADAPIVTCILGDENVALALATISAGKSAGDRRLRIAPLLRGADSTSCHILFVGASESAHARELLIATRRKHILTVADFPQFAAAGGIVELFEEGTRIRFAINVEASREANLVVSSQLLSLARIVNGPAVRRP